jgi:hypothetical protein
MMARAPPDMKSSQWRTLSLSSVEGSAARRRDAWELLWEKVDILAPVDTALSTLCEPY